ncbi:MULTISPECIES: hypothetical protein [Sinorhizobium]|uniref:hypothetical protein n=1 Tax=Sinorhizobium TaxID=28105 RepID=UPI001596A6B9|nr:MULTISPECIES: hypothetical protein [Sinorhizobium]
MPTSPRALILSAILTNPPLKTGWRLIERGTGEGQGKIRYGGVDPVPAYLTVFYPEADDFPQNLLKILTNFQFFTSKIRKSATSLDPHGF